MEFLIVTGISGAGKTQAAHALEDIGFYCVDNIPPLLLCDLYRVCSRSSELYERAAVIVDIRSGDEFDVLLQSLDRMGPHTHRILFLDASDDVLLRRYRFTRRKHPLIDAAGGSVEDAIAMERHKLAPLKERADYCMSFGYKHGVPTEADLMFDVRCLPNPYYVDGLRDRTGLDQPVYDYVMQWEQTIGFRDRLFDMIDYMLPMYCSEGKSQLVIAIGCSGGHHRSVALTQALYQHLLRQGRRVTVTHRDIEK